MERDAMNTGFPHRLYHRSAYMRQLKLVLKIARISNVTALVLLK
jgi:hypothetical protein